MRKNRVVHQTAISTSWI